MLREELKDSNIPHHTTIRKRIMEIWDEHLDILQDQMKVNFNWDLVFVIWLFILSNVLGKYPSPPTCGVIQISHHLWQSLCTGSKQLSSKLPKAHNISWSFVQIWSHSTMYRDDILESILQKLFSMSLIRWGSHQRYTLCHVFWSCCLSYYVQIGWVTKDNASNNDTFMSKLDEELKACNISFDKVGHRIRLVKQQDFHVDP